MLSHGSIKAIIFDMDGVLFDSTDCHAQAFTRVLTEQGILDFSYQPIAGMRTDEAFRTVFAQRDQPLPAELLQQLTAHKRRYAIQLLEEHGRLFPGSQALLAALVPTYRLALASSASSATVELFLRKLGHNPFEVVLAGDAVRAAKPDPALYTLACTQLALAPNQCLVIEDAIHGVTAAVRASMPAVALVDNERAAVFRKVGACATIPSLNSLQTLLTTK